MAATAYGNDASRASIASHSSKSDDKDISGPGITHVHDSVEVSHGPLDFLTHKFKRSHADPEDAETSSVDTDLPQGRQLGLISAVFLIVNRIVGTGVFATTSTLLAQSGSVGMSLLYWVIGAIVAAAGFAVYAEWATALPKNGGELNYLQHAYRKPKYLILTMYSAQALLLGQAAGNALTAGRYFLRAGGSTSNGYDARGIGVAVIVTAVLLHGTSIKWGLRFQNAIGSFKLIILLVIAFAGFAALAGHTKVPVENNFANAFEGTRNDVFGISSALYNALWSYVGYSNAMYAAGEIKNPARTLKIAGPLAIGVITVLYVLVQVAYYAAVPKQDVLESEQIVAALFFRNVFGERSARALSVFVALSATANVYSVIFAQGRLNQAVGREGIIPFARVFATNWPFKAPLAGLTWHGIVTLVILLAPPAGDAYNFVLNLSSYPLNVVNAAVGLALLVTYLPIPRQYKPVWAQDWTSPYKATLPITLFFFLISTFLVVVPWLPPKRPEDAVYEHTWYALAPAVSLGIFAGGAIYWFAWAVLFPKLGRYELVSTEITLGDGTIAKTFVRRKQ
ncbi:amino acid transporter [Ceraceosorus guamensis]|uniref:Amino acid transporter n=1 Tax=Ceraceosorus guamensis TaxID=1522189 RepID=A0A316W2N7_9BASI|nr:amino acid transporter [Ceraceosorus guamensis]PWN44157.1 amino acid transporter [Ceraceosorus guamensis]